MSISICRHQDRDNGLWTAEMGYERLLEVVMSERCAREFMKDYGARQKHLREYRKEADRKIEQDRLHRLKMEGRI